MQPPASPPSLTSPLVRAGWFVLLPWTIVLFWLCLRVDPVSLWLRQLMLLVPLIASVAMLFTVARIGRPSRERSAWKLMAVATSFVLAAELYYSAYQVLVDPAGPSGFSPYDMLSAIGAVIIVFGLFRVAGLLRARRADNLRLAADIVAILVVGFMAVYHFWVRSLAPPSTEWFEGVRWAVYSFIGVVILGLLVLVYLNMRPVRFPQMTMPLGGALAIFSVGLILTPMWQAAQSDARVTAAGASVVCLLVDGYYLMFMAGLTRFVGRDQSWRNSSSRLNLGGPLWPPTILAVVVLVAVSLMGWWAYEAQISTAEASLYVAASVIATLAFVARTGFASLEAGEWKSFASADPVTGAFNHRVFQERIESQLAVARRGEPFTVALLDLDSFSGINQVLGHAGGDAILRAVADALCLDRRSKESVYRLSGDEFAVIAPGVGRETAVEFGRRLLAAVRDVDVPGLPGLSASVGVLTVSDDSCQREELLVRADAAQAWAKYHGKNRVVAYDAHMVKALGVEERLRIREHESHLAIARALAAAVDARDSRNYYHSRNVAALVALLCADLAIDDEQARRIEIAAMLHDVGKIALSDDVLKRNSASPRMERAAREHATLGATLVESLGDVDMPAWVRSHHERWDGLGYPDGLVGQQIPYESRIISLADAYDSMTAGRRGGRQLSKGAAMQEVDHGIGTRFDPELAEAFIRVIGMTSSLGWADEWPES